MVASISALLSPVSVKQEPYTRIWASDPKASFVKSSIRRTKFVLRARSDGRAAAEATNSLSFESISVCFAFRPASALKKKLSRWSIKVSWAELKKNNKDCIDFGQGTNPFAPPGQTSEQKGSAHHMLPARIACTKGFLHIFACNRDMAIRCKLLHWEGKTWLWWNAYCVFTNCTQEQQGVWKMLIHKGLRVICCKVFPQQRYQALKSTGLATCWNSHFTRVQTSPHNLWMLKWRMLLAVSSTFLFCTQIVTLDMHKLHAWSNVSFLVQPI